jgi:hypothetical protein
MKPPAYPPTLGEFVGLGWRMQGLCVPCNGVEKFDIDIDMGEARSATVI